MLNILCEIAPGNTVAAIAGAVVAGMAAMRGWDSWGRRKNGNGGGCGGKGCERLARVETKQDSFEKWLEKVEAKLDRVLER